MSTEKKKVDILKEDFSTNNTEKARPMIAANNKWEEKMMAKGWRWVQDRAAPVPTWCFKSPQNAELQERANEVYLNNLSKRRRKLIEEGQESNRMFNNKVNDYQNENQTTEAGVDR